MAPTGRRRGCARGGVKPTSASFIEYFSIAVGWLVILVNGAVFTILIWMEN